MTLVVTANVVGQVRGEPVRLPNRRRRLSTIVARHKPAAGRQFIVSVHRKGAEAFKPTDRSVRLRAAWKSTLVGPEDVVLITVVPLGKSFLSIGLAIASIALIAIAPYAAPAIAAGLTGVATASAGATFAVQAGLVIGGLALGYAAQAAKGAGKGQKQAELYSLSGGGNVPKPGSRRPLLYGRCWSAPPLSQGDYFLYDGDTMVLTKRMTLGIGKFQVHRIRVGDALFWNESSGLQPPFNSTATGNLGTAIEILYEQVSQIASGDVITSNAVSGQEMPRPGGNPDRTPWFRLTPQAWRRTRPCCPGPIRPSTGCRPPGGRSARSRAWSSTAEDQPDHGSGHWPRVRDPAQHRAAGHVQPDAAAPVGLLPPARARQHLRDLGAERLPGSGRLRAAEPRHLGRHVGLQGRLSDPPRNHRDRAADPRREGPDRHGLLGHHGRRDPHRAGVGWQHLDRAADP